MTRYAKYMQHIHDIGTANTIENAVSFVIEDIIDYLKKTGVKPESNLLNEIRKIGTYAYKS